MNKIKVGHDSEIFAERSGTMFPMIGAVGGTKEHPLPVPGGTLQEDNVSIELAIDATADEDHFVQLTHNLLAEVEKKIKANNCTMVLSPSVEFSTGVIEMFSPVSKESGCDPDYNVYTKAVNQYPSMEDSLMRHASGHLHVDCARAVETPELMYNLISLQDVLIKLPQWLLEGDVPRNQMQGALGNYRPKVYGAEYRSSSNIILTDDKILRHAFKYAVKASRYCAKGKKVSAGHIHEIKELMAKGKKKHIVDYISYYGGEEIKI